MLLNEKNSRLTLCGELALLVAVIINSFSVVLMLYSGSGISAISSVPGTTSARLSGMPSI